MTEKTNGLYYSGSEDSYRELRNENLVQSPKITFNKPSGKDAQGWFEEAQRRSETRAEVEDSYDYAKIEFTADRPLIVGITGDWHLGSEIDTEMLKRDIGIIAEHPLVAGAFFTGDLTDSANFNPAQDEDMLNFEEQSAMLTSIFDYIGKERILALWKGNHDHKWERKFGGSKYTGMSSRYEAPVFYGNAFVDFFVNDVNYHLMGSHRLRGNSIYNNAHPTVRGHREVQNLDLTFAGHIHKRGHIEQPVREFNKSRNVYGLINGTYQLGSEYTKDSGYGIQRGAELGMYWVAFGHDKKSILIMDTDHMLSYAGRFL